MGADEQGVLLPANVLPIGHGVGGLPPRGVSSCRQGWRARLAYVEQLIDGALQPGAIGRPVREFTRGEMADIEMALAEIRAMLDDPAGREGE